MFAVKQVSDKRWTVRNDAGAVAFRVGVEPGPEGQIMCAYWPDGRILATEYAVDEDWDALYGEALDCHVREWVELTVLPEYFGEIPLDLESYDESAIAEALAPAA